MAEEERNKAYNELKDALAEYRRVLQDDLKDPVFNDSGDQRFLWYTLRALDTFSERMEVDLTVRNGVK